MNTNDIKAALKNRFSDGYACFDEFRNGTGYGHRARYIDFLVVGLWEKDQNVYAIEIKVSRSDFLSDVAKFEKKQKDALDMSNVFYYAVPHGLVSPEEVPEGCGLYYIQTGGRVVTARAAQRREISPNRYMDYIRAMASRTKDNTTVSEHVVHFVGRDWTEDELHKYIESKFEKRIYVHQERELAQQVKEGVERELNKIERYQEAIRYYKELKNAFPFKDHEGILQQLKKSSRAYEALETVRKYFSK